MQKATERPALVAKKSAVTNLRKFSAMSIFGRLSTMPLGDLLQWVAMTKRSGMLSLDRAAIHKELFFHDGRLISASSSDPREYLSQFLLMNGAVSEKELERLYRHLADHGGKLGQLLVEIGMVPHEELQRYLRLKAEESIYDCFLWLDGSFHFFIDEPSHGEHLPIVSEINAVIMEGLRRADEWKRIRMELPAGTALIQRAGALSARVSERARALHGLLDDTPQPLAPLGLSLHLTDFYLFSSAAELARAGAAKFTALAKAPPVEADNGVDHELLLASDAVARQDFTAARVHLSALLRIAPHHPAAAELMRRVSEHEARREDGGVASTAVPSLARKLRKKELAGMSPSEQFLISRMDGTRTVADLIHISPLHESEVRVLIAAFAAARLVKLTNSAV